MNKKENFLKLLESKTGKSILNGGIVWNIGSSNDVRNYVPNADQIVRVVKTIYRNTNVFYVEQKHWSYSSEYDTSYESVGSFVLVEKDFQLVMTIYPAEIADYIYEEFSNAVVESIEGRTLDDLLDDDDSGDSVEST